MGSQPGVRGGRSPIPGRFPVPDGPDIARFPQRLGCEHGRDRRRIPMRARTGKIGRPVIRHGQIRPQPVVKAQGKTVAPGESVQVRDEPSGLAGVEQTRVGLHMVEPARSLAGVVHDPALGHAGQVQPGGPDAGAQIQVLAAVFIARKKAAQAFEHPARHEKGRSADGLEPSPAGQDRMLPREQKIEVRSAQIRVEDHARVLQPAGFREHEQRRTGPEPTLPPKCGQKRRQPALFHQGVVVEERRYSERLPAAPALQAVANPEFCANRTKRNAGPKSSRPKGGISSGVSSGEASSTTVTRK
jgi:hypothetical protein